MIRHRNSLRYKTIKKLSGIYSELFPPLTKRCVKFCKNYISESNQWWLILLLVLCIFILSSVCSFRYIQLFDLHIDTAKIIVDQRTANIAAITSITLVVVGFMINNLAIKEPVAFQLLFKHSYLYPIIYYILIVIGFFVIISTLRDELDAYLFTKLVVTGTYLALIVLVLIGLLFRTILKFSNNAKIRQMLEDELTDEANKKIKQSLISQYSVLILDEEMKVLNVQKYDWTVHAQKFYTQQPTSIFTNSSQNTIETKIIYDINLKKLNKFLKKYKYPEVAYKQLALERATTEYNDYIINNVKQNSEKQQSKLVNCLSIKRGIKEKSKGTTIVREYFDEKFDDAIKKSNEKNLEEILQSYYKLYEIELKYQ